MENIINYDAFLDSRFGERRLPACWRRQLADAFFSARLPKKGRQVACAPQKRLFRRDAESPRRTGTSTRDACATQKICCNTRSTFSVLAKSTQLPVNPLLQPRRSSAPRLFYRPILPRQSRCIYRATFSLPDRKRCLFSDRRTPAQRPIRSHALSHCRDRSRQRRKDSQ